MKVNIIGAIALNRRFDNRATRCPIVYLLSQQAHSKSDVASTQFVFLPLQDDYKPDCIPANLSDIHKSIKDNTRAYNLTKTLSTLSDESSHTIIDKATSDVFTVIDYLAHCRKHNASVPGLVDPKWLSADNLLAYRNQNDFEDSKPCLIILDVSKGVPAFNFAAYSLDPTSDIVYTTLHPLDTRHVKDWTGLAAIQAEPRSSSTLVLMFHPNKVEFAPFFAQLFPGRTVNDVANELNVSSNFIITKNYGAATTRGSTDSRVLSDRDPLDFITAFTNTRG